MSVEISSPVDITHLPLRQAAQVIDGEQKFTIGTVSVNPTKLLRETGMTYRGLALEEARALGQRMVEIEGRSWDPYLAEISRVEPRKPMAPGNVVLETVPILGTRYDKTTGEPVRPHSWIFGVHAIAIRGRQPDLHSISLEGDTIGGLATQETYYRSMRALAGGPITAERLPNPGAGEPEDPNDLFYVAELGVLRAARMHVGDRQAAPVIE